MTRPELPSIPERVAIVAVPGALAFLIPGLGKVVQVLVHDTLAIGIVLGAGYIFFADSALEMKHRRVLLGIMGLAAAVGILN